MNKKIAIIEDEAIFVLSICMLLSRNNYDVPLQHANSNEALMTLLEKEVDLILLDVNIPGSLNGVELGLKLRESKIKTPIIFITAYSNEELLKTIEKIDNCYYLEKPIKEAKILSKINNILKNSNFYE